MPIQFPDPETAFSRAEELFQNGDNTTGFLYMLLAVQIHGTSPLPTALQHRAQALPHYAALLNETRRQALRARSTAYAPYSHYSVGAALLADDGTIWSGCNVEASSYGLTICAERNALTTAVARGKRRFSAVVVATQSPSPASPCGMCRQMLYEFAPNGLVLMVNLLGEERWTTVGALLPDAFGLEE